MKCVLLTKPVIYERVKLTVGASNTELGIKGYKITEYRSTTDRKPKVVGEAELITSVYALFLLLNVGLQYLFVKKQITFCSDQQIAA